MTKTLIGLPIFNEEELLANTLDSLWEMIKDKDIDVLALNDGSTDQTEDILYKYQKKWGNKLLLNSHGKSLGYGRTINEILRFGCENKEKYEIIITFDADLQHDPITVPSILKELNTKNYVDVCSASRYLDNNFVQKAENVPIDRFLVNMCVGRLINHFYDLNLSDTFSGFKGYRVCRVESLFKMRDVGYSSPIEFWINAAYHGLFITEVPTPLRYIKGRESRGNEKPWEVRFKDYMNAFRKYALEDDKKHYIDEIQPVFMNFIDTYLNKYFETGINILTSYSNFWNKYSNEFEENLHNTLKSKNDSIKLIHKF
ncbi:MAG: glycosyltransferase family 2 protein [Candidatus Thorarchaeota archaeon]